MQRYDANGELAPSRCRFRAIVAEMKRTGASVCLRLMHLGAILFDPHSHVSGKLVWRMVST